MRLRIFFALAVVLFPASLFAQGQYYLSATGNGWTWNSPTTGQSFPKVHLLSLVDTDNYVQSAGTVCATNPGSPPGGCEAQLCVKYGGTWTGGCSSWTAWAIAQSVRMKSLGFTGAGFESFRYQNTFTAGMLPYEKAGNYGFYAVADSQPYHVKNAGWIQTTSGMKCGTNYYNGGNTPDPYDPEFPIAFAALYAADIVNTGMPNTVFFNSDDADNLAVFDKVSDPVNSHPDGGLVIASIDPVVTVSSPTAGGAYSYTNKTFFAKQGLAAWLQAEYGTIAALNTAWHTSYTTFGTSDAGGLTGIANGTYSSYGTGTGFLDEAGTNLVAVGQSCSGLSGNGPQQNESWGKYAQIQTDIDHWMAYGFAVQWATQVWTAYKAACGSYCSPIAIPIYEGPVSPASSSVYAGIASALAGDSFFFWIAPSNMTSVANYTAAVQSILNADGNTPVVVAHYFVSQPDSFIQTPESCAAYSGSAIDCQSTQALRGSNWVSAMTAVIHLQCPSGKYCVVGDEQWSFNDQYGYANFGLFTVNDNGYDGSSASTATSSGACATSHSYTSPAICLDGNSNYESLAVSSCTSASSHPTWTTTYYSQTTDGTCTWFETGPYTRNVETASYGNALLPIATFNLSNLSDPVAPNTGFVLMVQSTGSDNQ